ncbi:hypothetical protein M1295_00100 [Patescibacteria group bacterium]|nr:hypothetical protein [Patescibacteria group bacterium]
MSNRRKILIALIVALVVVAIAFAVDQWFVLRKAHSTFENYYAFRGCVQLLDKTDAYGVCKTPSGAVVKIVQYRGEWYLDGDLPWGCLGSVCFGI